MFVSLSNGVDEAPEAPCTAAASSLDPPILHLAQARASGMLSPLLRAKA